MTSFGLLRVDIARQLGIQRVSASGPASKPSPLLSPRCHPAAHTSTPAAAYRADRVATAEPAAPQHSSAVQRRSSGFDDSYDSAVPMAALPGWERVEEGLGLGPEELGSDPQEWEEMVSLLSFDGEEHKRVTRQMHGANARVEDMFASFDGDDFEAVMRATRGEVPNDGAQPTDSPPQQTQAAAPGSSSTPTSLYQAVCALRAAAQAAEVAKKRCPALKKRRTPLGDSSSNDAWMLQVPHAVAVQQQQQPGGAAAQGCRESVGGGGPQQHSKPGSSLPARVQMAYVGVSCDSSSDGSCDASQDEQQAAAAQPAAAQHMAAAVGSNNIVSSRALATKLAPAAAAVAEAGSPARSMAKGAIATAVLEAAPVAVAVAAAAPTAVAQLAAKDVAQQTASQQILEGAAHVAKGRGWSSSSTKGLRRALARLHHTLPRE